MISTVIRICTEGMEKWHLIQLSDSYRLSGGGDNLRRIQLSKAGNRVADKKRTCAHGLYYKAFGVFNCKHLYDRSIVYK